MKFKPGDYVRCTCGCDTKGIIKKATHGNGKLGYTMHHTGGSFYKEVGLELIKAAVTIEDQILSITL